MKVELPKNCLVDTVYISALGNRKDYRHQSAHSYHIALQANQTRFYLPSFAIGELLAAQIDDSGLTALLGLLQPKILAYDATAAKKYAELTKLHPGFFRGPRDEKNRRIVDLMVVAMADVNGIESIISQDKHMCSTFLKGTNIEGLDFDVPLSDRYPLYRQTN